MSKEIEKLPDKTEKIIERTIETDYQLRQRKVKDAIAETIGDHTPEYFAKKAKEVPELIREYNALLDWYTDETDRIIGTNNWNSSSRWLIAKARIEIKLAYPAKFKRLRDLEIELDIQGATARVLAAGANTSIIKQELKNRIFDD